MDYHKKAKFGWGTEDPEIFTKTDSQGISVAYYMIANGWIIENPDYLDYRDPFWKKTLRQCMIDKLEREMGFFLTQDEILSLSTGNFYDNYRKLMSKVVENKKRDTLAHAFASRGFKCRDKRILSLRNKTGETVAHRMAGYCLTRIIEQSPFSYLLKKRIALLITNWTTDDIEVLKWTDSKRWTVAHEQAKNGWTTVNPSILNLTDLRGISVKSLLQHRESKSCNSSTRLCM